MSERQLLARVRSLLAAVRACQYDGMLQRDQLLEQADACLQELEMRGTQLTLC